MSNVFVAVIHYGEEIVKTDTGVVFDSENTTKMKFSKYISLRELKQDIERKIGAEIVRLRYRWKTSNHLVRYSTIALKDDEDVGLMIAEHDSLRIRSVELHAKLRVRYDDSGPSRNVYESSSQMGFDSAVEDHPYCKRIVQVDGTWLYESYKHVLLIAVTQDGNETIFPIAFAIVDKDSGNSWKFFLSNLRKHVIKEDGVCLISDRATTILATIDRQGSGWTPPHAYPAFCVRHIGKNAIERWKKPNLRSAILNMGYELVQPNFERMLENLRMEYGEDVWAWANNIQRKRWTQSYDVGRRYGQMTTNLVECINGVLNETRHLPIASLVRETYYRLAKVWSDKGSKTQSMINEGRLWSEDLVKKMEKNVNLGRSMVVHGFDLDGQIFDVVDSMRNNRGGHHQTFRVNFRQRWCDCGEFQAWRYPCKHATAVCMSKGVDPYSFADECFKFHTIINIYKCEFPPIANSQYWPPLEHDEWLPNPALRKELKGRPQSTRIHTSMDLHYREPGEPKRCTQCRGT